MVRILYHGQLPNTLFASFASRGLASDLTGLMRGMALLAGTIPVEAISASLLDGALELGRLESGEETGRAFDKFELVGAIEESQTTADEVLGAPGTGEGRTVSNRGMDADTVVSHGRLSRQARSCDENTRTSRERKAFRRGFSI
jgi:hypothetical protein